VVFAEQSDGNQAALLVFTTVLGGAVAWVASQFWAWRATRRKESLEDEGRELLRQESVIKRIDAERVELREELRKLEFDMEQVRTDLRAAIIRAETMSVWIRYLEAKLEEAGIPYQRWGQSPGAGSAPHAALPPAPEDKS
jgi:septal ring factor EnvC (AmiA/AmiB activator)